MATERPYAASEGSPFTLSPDLLRSMTDAGTFNRGKSYSDDGRVGPIEEREAAITAAVRGSQSCQVELRVGDGGVEYSCTCPVGEEGIFCKHCVALGLSWIRGETGGTPETNAADAPGEPVTTLGEVRSYLSGQEKPVLVDLLMERAMEDDRFGQRLLMKAAMLKGPDLTALREAIDAAVRTDGFVHYREMYDYSRGIEDTIAAIGKLLDEGHAEAVVNLSEHALKAIEGALGSVDDSDGYMGGLLSELQELHHSACVICRPDPSALAKRFFDWGMSSEWEVFLDASARYADVLGDEGLATYGKLAEAAWAGIPQLGPNDKEDEDHYGRRFRITHVMEHLTRQRGGIDALVAVKSRDLSTSYDYLEIAKIFREAGQNGRALEWAERGLQAFPERTDSRLREFVAEEYHLVGRHDEAMELIWVDFVNAPYLEKFQKLKAHADRVGQWSPWRERAFAHLRSLIAPKKEAARRRLPAWEDEGDGSRIQRILLWESDLESAWREARQSDCSEELWKELAQQREREHPEEALPIYQRQIQPALDRRNIDGYREALRWLHKVRELMVRMDKGSEFPVFLESVRSGNRAKRNFMKLIENARW